LGNGSNSYRPSRGYCDKKLKKLGQSFCLKQCSVENRFLIVERRFRDCNKKHIIATVEKVRLWLQYLFANHGEYVRMRANGQLEMSDEALQALQQQSELTEVVYDEDPGEDGETSEESGVVQVAMESGLSKGDVYTFTSTQTCI